MARCNIAAFFDFDKTILSKDSKERECLSLLRQVYPRNYGVPRWYPFRLIPMTVADRLKKWNVEVRQETMNRIYLATYKGIPMTLLQEHSQHLYQSQLKQLLFPDMLEKMLWHHQQGHCVIVVTATTHHLIEPFLMDLAATFDVICKGYATAVDDMIPTMSVCPHTVGIKVWCSPLLPGGILTTSTWST